MKMPRPQKRKKETWQDYISRLIKHYIEEGYPRNQAIAIAYKVADQVKRNQTNKIKKYSIKLIK